jgi:hypothetical protein
MLKWKAVIHYHFHSILPIGASGHSSTQADTQEIRAAKYVPLWKEEGGHSSFSPEDALIYWQINAHHVLWQRRLLSLWKGNV